MALTQSGKDVTYPHLQPERLLRGPWALATAVLVLQAAMVLWGMRGVWAPVGRWVGRCMGRCVGRNLSRSLSRCVGRWRCRCRHQR